MNHEHCFHAIDGGQICCWCGMILNETAAVAWEPRRHGPYAGVKDAKERPEKRRTQSAN
jgi:hypothetical protein